MTQRKDQKWLSAWLYSPRPTPLCRSHWFLDWLQLFVAAATPSSGLRLEGDLRGKFINKISLFYPSMGRSRIKCVQLVIISYNTNVTLVPNAFFGNSQRRAPSTWFLSSRARKSNWIARRRDPLHSKPSKCWHLEFRCTREVAWIQRKSGQRGRVVLFQMLGLFPGFFSFVCLCQLVYQEQDVVEQDRDASCALNQSLSSESFL